MCQLLWATIRICFFTLKSIAFLRKKLLLFRTQQKGILLQDWDNRHHHNININRNTTGWSISLPICPEFGGLEKETIGYTGPLQISQYKN